MRGRRVVSTLVPTLFSFFLFLEQSTSQPGRLCGMSGGYTTGRKEKKKRGARCETPKVLSAGGEPFAFLFSRRGLSENPDDVV